MLQSSNYGRVFQTDDQIVNHLINSKANSDVSKSRLSDMGILSTSILQQFGMSGLKTRHLLNNLSSVPNLKYGEVGTYTGSTLLSAMYANKIMATCCDNWSQFGGPSDTFKRNIDNFFLLQNNSHILNVLEGDFKNETIREHSSWTDTDFYFFDGPHDEESQYLGITKYFNCLSDRFLLMVDDWHWGAPRKGTERALKELPVTVLHRIEVQVDSEIFDSLGRVINRFQNSDYHNGIAVFACRKR